MRQVVLDTETTGIGPERGHRIIEIGCVEIIDRLPTEKVFHTYLNPERSIEEAAARVHGIKDDFVRDKPLFSDVVEDFLSFIQDAEVIIHNAPFDVGFINAELRRLKWSHSMEKYCVVTDSLAIARRKHPGQRNSLDALCKRYEIDNSNRSLHGAMLDADLLARVYLAMTSSQSSLFENSLDDSNAKNIAVKHESLTCNSPVILANPDELAKHKSFLAIMSKNKK